MRLDDLLNGVDLAGSDLIHEYPVVSGLFQLSQEIGPVYDPFPGKPMSFIFAIVIRSVYRSDAIAYLFEKVCVILLEQMV